MTTLLLILLVTAEIGFAGLMMTVTSPRREWTAKRLIVNAGELCIYLLTVLLPGIDFSFRFTGLIILLVVRIVVSGIFFLIRRHNENPKRHAAMIISAVMNVVLLLVSMVPAFIFRDYKGRPVSGPYHVRETEAILIDRSRLEEYENDGSYREVPVHFYYPEEAGSIGKNTLPLVIFSHGAFGYYQSNASTYMELASNGYVVISLDHPYHAFFTKDSDGRTVIVDRAFLDSAMRIGGNDNVPEAEVYDTTSKWMEIREADMNYVIDTVKETVSSGSYANWFIEDKNRNDISDAVSLIDADRIGLMGHSLGGATAVTVGRRDDVDAVIDIDGTMLGEETGVTGGQVSVNQVPYKTPLLALDSESHHAGRIEAAENGYVYANNVILDNASEGFGTYFKGAEHMDFTDLPLFSPFLAGLLGRGTVESEACIDQVNRLVLDFFDCYLKDKGEFTVKAYY